MKQFIILSFSLCVCSLSHAQFKNINLDEQADSDCIGEPGIAINPRNPLNIVAASAPDNLYFTKDGGATWQKREARSSFGVNGDPAVIAGAKGDFYFFHLSEPTGGKGGYETKKSDRVVVQHSGDGGETWSDGETIGFNPPKDQDKAWPAIDTKNNLYVTWTQFNKYGDADPNCHSNIMLSASRNGRKWGDPIQISQTPGNCVDDDNTAIGAVPATFENKIFVAWANQGKIFMDRSFDGNMWLSNDMAIAEQPGGWNLKIPGHGRCNGMPILMTDKSKGPTRGSLYLAWADQRNGENDTDIWFIRSNNFGDNWTSPLRVNNDSPGKHQYLPWMAVDQLTGAIYIIYYDRRNYTNLQTDVYLAYSFDGGLSFKNTKISDTPFTPSESSFFGDYTNISAHKGIIAPIWTRMDEGKTSIWAAIIKQQELTTVKQ